MSRARACVAARAPPVPVYFLTKRGMRLIFEVLECLLVSQHNLYILYACLLICARFAMRVLDRSDSCRAGAGEV